MIGVINACPTCLCYVGLQVASICHVTNSIDQVASFGFNHPLAYCRWQPEIRVANSPVEVVGSWSPIIYPTVFFSKTSIRWLGMGFLKHHFRSMLMYLLEFGAVFGASIFRSSDRFLRRHQPNRTRSKMPLSVSTISVSNHVAVVVVLAYPRCFTRKKIHVPNKGTMRG